MAPRQKPGKLTIFFGMTPGVGKTFAMLKAAHEEADAGRDVVVALLETHNSKRTAALARSLNQINRADVPGNSSLLAGVDVEAVIARRAHVAIVDELAHTNPPGSRHPYRYQDVRELLLAGVDVFTTLNLHNVLSEAETVQRITGLQARETVPDSILDGAEIRLIDLPPGRLLQRLRLEMSYLTQDTGLSTLNFFSERNLVVLREMAWRFVANHLGGKTRAFMRQQQAEGPWKSGPRLLAVIRPGADSEKVVRWTRRLADASNVPWLAVYVETPGALDEASHVQVAKALALAEESGAEVVTTTDHDIIDGILRVASQRNVTEIVVGKPRGKNPSIFSNHLFVRRLIRARGDFEIHVVATQPQSSGKVFRFSAAAVKSSLGQYAIAAAVTGAITLASYFLGPMIGGPYVCALIYLLAIVVLGSFVRRGPALMAATLSALMCDYFILPPVFAFRVSDAQDAVPLGIYFIVALILGQLTSRIRAQQQAEHQREDRATALYLFTRELNEAATLDQIAQCAISHMGRAFKAQVMIFSAQSPGQFQQLPFASGGTPLTREEELAVSWVLKHGERAGKYTANIPLVEMLFAPLTVAGSVVGVAGVRLEQNFPPTIHQLNLLDSFSQQIAFALDRQRLREVSERAKLLAESERLTKTLLNSMSHEMRTPIAVISSALNNLLELQEENQTKAHREIFAAIQDATDRLNRLMGNVLDITRLESGHIQARFTECDVTELVNLAVNA
ncbi:MAG TPA: DUF4118 domain-containing protein, partial [Verrucomicrobiae bacterium]|nr:DUF4118 domain-containing protein [Verrucomicrobiae bacterium]